ncbi:MAG: type VI secretion system baseplate subunit TssE [Rhodothermaceae bacterium]
MNSNTIKISLYDKLLGEISFSRNGNSNDKTFEEKKYKMTVLRDLAALLNTRSPSSTQYFDEEELTVVDYGIPDFANYSPAYEQDQLLLCKRITKAMKYFEPRIIDPFVIIDSKMVNERKLRIGINGKLKINKEVKQVTFIAEKGMNSMNWTVYEAL